MTSTNKCICDICGVNQVRGRFKFKQEKKTYDYSGFSRLRWENIDICDSCYNKFVRLTVDMSLEDEIMMKAISAYEEKYPDNVYMQSAYLEGVQAVYDLLLHKKIGKQ